MECLLRHSILVYIKQYFLFFQVDMEDIFNINFDRLQKTKNDPVENLELLIEKVQILLDLRFNNEYSRTQINRFDNRLTFSCPYCGDTKTNKNKFRGNIYFTPLGFKCFNCGITKNIQTFFKDFGDGLQVNSIELGRINTLSQNVWGNNKTVFFDKDNYAPFFLLTFDEFKNRMGFKFLNSDIIKYLRERHIPEQFFDSFLFHKERNRLIIPNIVEYNDERYVIAYTARILQKDYTGNRYLLFGYDHLFKSDEVAVELSEYQNFLMISNIFGFFNLNLNYDITICEGFLDSLFLFNACATSSASKEIPMEGDFLYLYDNDLTGHKKSLSHLKKGDKVFLWKKILSDLNVKNKSIKDINDLVCYCQTNDINFNNIVIKNYFSNKKIDALWI